MIESICTTGAKGVYEQDRGSPKSVVFKVLQNLGVGKNIWDQSYFCVAACCWKCRRSLQSASAILGTPIFFCFSCLPTVLSSCLVCCNKFKVLNAWDSVFGTSNYIEMRVWAYTVLYFFTTKWEKFKLRHQPYLFLKDSLLQPAAPRRLRRCTLGCSMNMDILIGIFVKVVIKSLATY